MNTNQLIFSCIISIITIFSSNAQQVYVNTEWQNTTGHIGSVHRTTSAVDNNGDILVVTNELNSSNNTDALIIKYGWVDNLATIL